MELNNWEKEFRNKLNEREITPSQNSWDRLDAMLNEVEEKKPKRNYNWLFIAASIIGFLFIGTLFFSQTDELINASTNNVVLETKETAKPLENAIQKKSQPIISPSIQSQSLAIIPEAKKTKNNLKDSKTIVSSKTTVVQNSGPKSDFKATTKQETEKFNSLNQDYTEVDELLAAVKLSSKNENPESHVKVDSYNLLSEVNRELELSFREKVINTIDKNYQNIKLVLSNRNHSSKNK